MDRRRIYRLLFRARRAAAHRQTPREQEFDDFVARGRVASAELLGAAPTRTYLGASGPRTRRIWALDLRVIPTHGPPFEASIEHAFLTYYSPVAGQALKVVYDPADHESVIVYPKDPSPAPGNLSGAGRGEPGSGEPGRGEPGSGEPGTYTLAAGRTIGRGRRSNADR